MYSVTSNQIPTRRSATGAVLVAPAVSAITAGGRTTLAALDNQGLRWLGGPAGDPRCRGIEISAFGVGANNTFFTRRFWGIKRAQLAGDTPLDDLSIFPLLTARFTLSSALSGSPNNAVISSSSYFLADGAAIVTKGAYLTALETAFGFNAIACSPDNDAEEARIIVPFVGGVCGIYDEPASDGDTATSGAVLIEELS